MAFTQKHFYCLADVRLVELSTEGSCAVSISVLTLRANPDAFFRAFAELLASRGWLRPAS